MSQNTKKEAARVNDGLVTTVQNAHGGLLDADTARGLVLMAMKTPSVRRAIVAATNPPEMPTEEQLAELHLPAKKVKAKKTA